MIFAFSINAENQQKVDYQIRVNLDDKNHFLHAQIQFDYYHNFEESLDYIYIHLWPNAYSSKNTAFAKQQVENGQTDFLFASTDELGYIDSLDFKVNSVKAKWELDSIHPDIAKIYLAAPLEKGQHITVSSPFRVKIPKSFSRLGRSGNSYQITQWYPKPAVYDERGWHPMPYLNQGEFYSSFGSFNVEITLPENYVVGASGDLQNESEKKWLKEIDSLTRSITAFESDTDFPESTSQTKTLLYTLDNAHDFAWFADKRFHVLFEEIEVPNREEKVEVYAMFTNFEADLWLKVPDYMETVLQNMSEWVGPYPYNHFTAVEGALSAGAGMEYPAITIIGESRTPRALETVLVHEAIHNWFYGIFGFNERAYPWLDESFTSYYEKRYFEENYTQPGIFGDGIKESFLGRLFDLQDLPLHYQNQLFYLYQCRQNKDQALNLPSEDYTFINYAAMIYGKGPLVIDFLAHYLGKEEFDKVMQGFYAEWAFRHPWPEDVRNSFERETTQNLSWFFDDLIGTTGRMKYNIRRVKNSKTDTAHVYLTNRGDLATPLELKLQNKEKDEKTLWIPPFEKDTIVKLSSDWTSSISLDPEWRAPFYNRVRNTYNQNKLFKKSRPLRLQFLMSLENPQKNHLYFTPAFAWNKYDGIMAGITFYNRVIPAKKFEFALSPFYAFGSNDFSGTGFMRYNLHVCRDCVIQNLRFGVSGKRFHYYDLPYTQFKPFTEIHFKPPHPRSPFSSKLTFEHFNIHLPYYVGAFFTQDASQNKVVSNYYVNRLSYSWKNKRVLYPFSGNLYLEQGNGFYKAGLEKRFQLTYLPNKKGLNIRFFAGKLWDNKDDFLPDNRLKMSLGTGNRHVQADYTFEKYYLGRSESSGFLRNQVHTDTEGGFRTVTSVGRSSEWLMAFNVDAELPFLIPVRPYFDFGIYPSSVFNPVAGQSEVEIKTMFSTGVTISVARDLLEINIPLFESDNIKDNHTVQGRDNLPKRITFVFQLHRINPFDRLDSL
ncbi:MAG: M1 family peptidase [Chitinophagaceae bacterium]|nr:MAG: M1 family peptidase [Chitinophagaceae bacterium]